MVFEGRMLPLIGQDIEINPVRNMNGTAAFLFFYRKLNGKLNLIFL